MIFCRLSRLTSWRVFTCSPCCTSSTPLKQLPPAEEQQPPANEESVEVINLVEPVNKRRLPADSLYEGEILEPQHAARFLLSGTGSYVSPPPATDCTSLEPGLTLLILATAPRQRHAHH